MLRTQMKISQRSREIGVPHQTLQGGQIHAAFQPVGREAVPQRMRGRGLGQPGPPMSNLKGPLNASRVPGFAAGIRKEPDFRPVILPVRAPFVEKGVAHGHGAIFVAFAGANPEEHTFGIDVCDLQMQQFLDAESAGVGGAVHGPFDGIAFGIDELFHLAGAEDGGERAGLFGEADFGHLPRWAFENVRVEESQGTGDLVEGAPGHALSDEVKLERSDLFGVKSIGRAVVMFAQFDNCSEVGFDGPRGEVAERHLVEKTLAQWGHYRTPKGRNFTSERQCQEPKKAQEQKINDVCGLSREAG